MNQKNQKYLTEVVFMNKYITKRRTPNNLAFLRVQPERSQVAADVRNRNISGGLATLRRQTCGAEEQAETAIARTPYEALTCALICGGDSRKHNG